MTVKDLPIGAIYWAMFPTSVSPVYKLDAERSGQYPDGSAAWLHNPREVVRTNPPTPAEVSDNLAEVQWGPSADTGRFICGH